MIILAQNVEAVLPAVDGRPEQGIPVIGYDRLITDPGAFYVTFDNIGVGRVMAEVVFGWSRPVTTSSSRATEPTPTPTSSVRGSER